MLTDTIPTPGWWLASSRNGRSAFPITQTIIANHQLSVAYVTSDNIAGYTHDPEAVLVWVRDGVLP